jgi:hypothetical protein
MMETDWAMDSSKIPQDLKNGLGAFDASSDAIIKSFVAPLELQEVPPTIYHYTDDAGLRGILESGRLWLSDIFKLNDPSELRHGFSHAVDILNSKAESGHRSTKIFAKQFATILERGMEGTAHYFVCSFSSDGNDLGQWRAYADNGRGYALGFDGKALENAFTKENGVPIPHNSTHHVIYNDAELADIHRRMIENMFPLISGPNGRRMDGPTINAYMMDLSVSLSLHALRASLFFKHGAYINEKEFRFLQIYEAGTPLRNVKRRYRSYELVKYREFDWRCVAAGALKQIMVGPAADPTKGIRFAQDCLAEFHTPRGGVAVIPSGIPYRAVST